MPATPSREQRSKPIPTDCPSNIRDFIEERLLRLKALGLLNIKDLFSQVK